MTPAMIAVLDCIACTVVTLLLVINISWFFDTKLWKCHSVIGYVQVLGNAGLIMSVAVFLVAWLAQVLGADVDLTEIRAGIYILWLAVCGTIITVVSVVTGVEYLSDKLGNVRKRVIKRRNKNVW